MFIPRQFETIFKDALDYVVQNSDLTDDEIGSVIRSILEATSLEDDEQYFQMVQLLDAFNIRKATGPELDKRVADFGITRAQPRSSTGRITILDSTLTTSLLAFDTPVGATSLILEDSNEFPTSGPYTVRIGEGTIAVEDATVTANNISTNTLTILSALNAHSIGDRVSVVTGASDKVITSGLQSQVPADTNSAPIVTATVESGIIINGNYQSTSILAKAIIPGSAGNLGVGQVSQFTGAAPFNGALVTNLTIFSGGRDLESDDDLKDRALAQLQTLSAGTVLSLKQAALGVSDPVTGQTVKTANVFEDLVNDEVIVYVDDGTGFSPDQVTLAQSTLSIGALIGNTTITVNNSSKFPGDGYIIISPQTSIVGEIIKYTAVNYSTNTLTLDTLLIKNHAIGDEVALLDVITLNAEPDASFFKLAKYPIVRNSHRIWVVSGGNPVLKINNIDYILNRGNSNLQIIGGLAAGSKLVLHYTYYTNLIFQVQKVLNGDPNDPVNFPGFNSAGVVMVVNNPVIRRVSVQVSVTAKPGVNEDDINPLVKEAIENYISNLGIGDDVILAKIIQVSMNVNGVFDCIPVIPLSDIVVLEGELPVAFDSNGNSLVSVL